MGMHLHRIGASTKPARHTWSPGDCGLYAVAVGASTADEAFVLDTPGGRGQLVYPTFVLAGVLAAEAATWPDPAMATGDYDWDQLVLGEQGLELFGPIPAAGDVSAVTTVAAIYDKGSGALVVLETDATDNRSGQCLFRASTGVFVIGAGGFGGPRGPAPGSSAASTTPDRAPDVAVRSVTSPVQTLLYRYAGNDRNPMHADVATARRAGYREPILMGQNTLGFAARAIVHACCGGDPVKLQAIGGRFAGAGYNGDTLVTQIWHDEPPVAAGATGASASGTGTGLVFRVVNQDGTVLVDRGTATLRRLTTAGPNGPVAPRP
jgi:acyl dehydratase